MSQAPADLARQPALPRRHFRGADLAGSLNAATTAFSIAVCSGVIVFAPLGAQFLAHGVVACLFAVVVGGAIASLVATSPTMLSAPSTAACIVLAGFVSAMSRAVPDLPATTVIALTGLTACTAGLLQMMGAALRLGRLVRFVPFPVVSGFSHGIALTLFLAYLPLFLGVADVPRVAWPSFEHPHPAAIVVGGFTLVAVIAMARWSARLPAIFLGLVAGGLATLALQAALPGIDTGAAMRPGNVPPLYSPFIEWAALPVIWRDPQVPRLVVSFALALAAVSSIASVVAAAALETQYHVRTQPDRDLLAQGLGNVVSGAFGGTTVSISLAASQGALEHGAQSRGVPPVVSALVIVTGLAGAVLVSSLPLAVLAALMLFVAHRLADPWGIALVKRVLRRPRRLDPVAQESFAVYLLVVLAILLLDVVAALAVGLIVASVVFIRSINRHVVRRVVIGAAVKSRRLYPPAIMPALTKALEAVAVIELDGPLFFGTADRISTEVERLSPSIAYVIIDLHRAQALDATADAVLARTRARLASDGRRLLIAGRPHGFTAASPAFEDAFADRDHAVEWVEQHLIAALGTVVAGTVMEPSRVAEQLGLTVEEGLTILGITRVLELGAGERVFGEGDPSNELYYLLAGRISIHLAMGDGTERRVVTFLAGNSFGDVAFLDGRPRTASAVCDEPCRVLVIARDAVQALSGTHPDVVAKVFGALALDMAARLRATDRLLREEIGS